VPAALRAAEQLAEEGVSAAVVDARFVKPLDADLLGDVAARVRAVVTVEDHAALAGFGSAVLEALADAAPGAHVHRMGVGDRFVEHDEPDAQWRAAGIDAAAIAARAAAALRGARGSGAA
jgi:1-deoxy-D-xylulose-5-phosphate synthase